MTYTRFVSVLSVVAFAVVAMGVAPVWASSDDTAENNVTASVDEQLFIAPNSTAEGFAKASTAERFDATGLQIGSSAIGGTDSPGGEPADVSFNINLDHSTKQKARVKVNDAFRLRSNVQFDVTVKGTNIGTSGGNYVLNYNGTKTDPDKGIHNVRVTGKNRTNNDASWGSATLNNFTLQSSNNSTVPVVENAPAGSYGVNHPTNSLDVNYTLRNLKDSNLVPGKYGLDLLWTITSSS